MTSNTYLPVPNPTKSFWLSLQESDSFSTYKSSESVPKKTDILIIGSGYSGASTAYNLLKEDPTLDITIFEARTVCSGATGRNGGHLKPYHHRMYYEYEKKHGIKVAAQVVNSEVEHLYTIKDLIEKEKIDCDFVLTRACDVYADDQRLQNDYLSYRKLLENPFVNDEVKKTIQYLEGAECEVLSKVPNVKACFTAPAAHLWPWKFVTGLLKSCVTKGLKLYTNTTVTKVRKDELSGDFIVEAATGTTISKKVVFCTNAYTKAILKEFKDTIVPSRGVVTHIKPISTPIPQLPNTYLLFEKFDMNSDYLINRADGSVVVGGTDSLFIGLDGNYTDLYDTVDDSQIPYGAVEYFSGYMEQKFSTWNLVETVNDYTWCGILGFTKDSFPFVGELDFLNMKNAFISAGFSGHGMPRVFLSGKALARCILTGKSIQEVGGIPECYYASALRLQERGHSYKEEIEEYIESIKK